MANLKQRFYKIEWLKNATSSFFKEKPEGIIDRRKLVAEFCVAFNSTERTAKECLRVLEGTGLIKINGEEISNAN
jgi:mannose-6-phosphate isomerase-like protein (cupin superfamily)